MYIYIYTSAPHSLTQPLFLFLHLPYHHYFPVFFFCIKILAIATLNLKFDLLTTERDFYIAADG